MLLISAARERYPIDQLGILEDTYHEASQPAIWLIMPFERELTLYNFRVCLCKLGFQNRR